MIDALITAGLGFGSWLALEFGLAHRTPNVGQQHMELLTSIGLDAHTAADMIGAWGNHVLLYEDQLIGSYIGAYRPDWNTYAMCGYYRIVRVEHNRVVLQHLCGRDRDFACLPKDLVPLMRANLDSYAMGVEP